MLLLTVALAGIAVGTAIGFFVGSCMSRSAMRDLYESEKGLRQ